MITKPSKTYKSNADERAATRRSRQAYRQQAQSLSLWGSMSADERATLTNTHAVVAGLMTSETAGDLAISWAGVDWACVPDAPHIVAASSRADAIRLAPIDWATVSSAGRSSERAARHFSSFPKNSSDDSHNFLLFCMWDRGARLFEAGTDAQQQAANAATIFWRTVLNEGLLSGNTRTASVALGGHSRPTRLIDIAVAYGEVREVMRLLPHTTWDTPSAHAETVWAACNLIHNASDKLDQKVWSAVASSLDMSQVNWLTPCPTLPPTAHAEDMCVPLASIWMATFRSKADWPGLTRAAQSAIGACSEDEQVHIIRGWAKLAKTSLQDLKAPTWGQWMYGMILHLKPLAQGELVRSLIPRGPATIRDWAPIMSAPGTLPGILVKEDAQQLLLAFSGHAQKPHDWLQMWCKGKELLPCVVLWPDGMRESLEQLIMDTTLSAQKIIRMHPENARLAAVQAAQESLTLGIQCLGNTNRIARTSKKM